MRCHHQTHTHTHSRTNVLSTRYEPVHSRTRLPPHTLTHNLLHTHFRGRYQAKLLPKDPQIGTVSRFCHGSPWCVRASLDCRAVLQRCRGFARRRKCARIQSSASQRGSRLCSCICCLSTSGPSRSLVCLMARFSSRPIQMGPGQNKAARV